MSDHSFVLGRLAMKLGLVVSLAAAGCASPTEDETATSTAAISAASAANHAADHCELYVDGLGLGEQQYLWSVHKWLEAYIHVNPDIASRVAGAGMWVRYSVDGVSRTEIRDGDVMNGGAAFRFRLSTTTTETTDDGDHVYPVKEVSELAFFVDVERDHGQRARLWVSNGGANFRLDRDFDGHATFEQGLGNGRIRWLTGRSAIFDQKLACPGF